MIIATICVIVAVILIGIGVWREMNTLRIFMAELCLRLAVNIAPDNDDGHRLISYIVAYIEEAIEAKND
jgi:hypothetical protein